MAARMNVPTTNTDRWRDFARDDLLLVQATLCDHAERVTQDAERGRLTKGERPAAAASFLRACKLAYEISDVLREKHPPIEHAAMMAASIETGEFAELARAARMDTEGGEWT